MRRILLVALVSALVGAFAVAGVAAAQEEIDFELGFKQFHDLTPELIGDPVEPERHDVIGNAFQLTTGGFLVWHRLGNVMDFTNGFQTFVLTSEGLLERTNESKFPFEIVRDELELLLRDQILELIEEQPEQLEAEIEELVQLFEEQLEVLEQIE